MPDVHARLETPGLKFEYHGSEALYERAVAELLRPLTARGTPAKKVPQDGPTSTATSSESLPSPSKTGYQPPSDRFGVFQRQMDPEEERTSHRVAAYAFFLWNYEKKEVFKEREVEACFEADGHPITGDALAEAYGDLLGRRMVSPGAQDHTWRLTGKGRDYVRHHLLSA